MEEIARQAGWAKTFGLPLELISPAEAQELFPPMSTDGVLGAAYLPTDGYIDPSQLTFALAEGARRRGAEVDTHTRVTGHRASSAVASPASRPTGATIETEIVVNAGGMFAAEIGALAGVTVPLVPMAHEYLVLEPSGLPLEMPTMRDPSLLVYFRPESGGLIMGGYERHCAPWSLDGIPADFNGKLLEEDWPRFEELMDERDRPRAVARGDGRRASSSTARRRSRPTASSSSGRPTCAASGSRRASARTGSRAPAAWGSSSPSGSSRGRPSLDVWHMDSRRFGAAYRSRDYTLARTTRDLRDVLRRQVPGARARRPGGRCASRAANARLRELGAAFGEKSGWERANWFEPNAAQRRRVAPAAGLGRASTGRPRSAPSTAACRESAALFDESSFAKLDVDGRGRRRLPRASLREPRRARGRARHVHADAERARRDRVRLHGDAARGGPVPHRHRHGVRAARRGVDPPARARRRLRRTSPTSRRPTRASASGGPRAGRSCSR